jgi:hypothetical protein
MRTLGIWTTAFAMAVSAWAFGQARVVINNDAWVRIDNGAWVVVEEPSSAGIQTLGTGGNIRSEGEFNRIRWQIRNTTGTYLLPFTTANGVKMPFTYEAIGGASNEAQASICFSTYNYGALAGTNWNNDLYRPSDVTHMHNYWTGAPVNNSDNVVDRFWIVDPGASGYAYGTRPAIRLGFTYDPGAGAGEVRPGNAITSVSPVGAQRFNAPLGQWGDFWPAGTFAAGPVNTVTNVNVPAADFFRSWTLSNILEPLPVELLRFGAECHAGRVQVAWSTASEQGVGRFVIERSPDGLAFDEIGSVNATGNSSTLVHYAFIDDRPLSLGYYRLRTVDNDGSRTLSSVVAAPCGAGALAITSAWHDGDALRFTVSSPRDQAASLAVFDASGKLVGGLRRMALTEGSSTFELDRRGLSTGIYVLSIAAEDGPLVRRVPLY